MTNELDEGVLHEDPARGGRRDHVGHAVDGEHEAQPHQLQGL